MLLIGEAFSPWTKKTRWALEYCELSYKYQEYTPTLSEPSLRWRLKQWSGSVSVPILFVDSNNVFRGSWEIAQYANNAVGDSRLGDFEAIASWNDLSEAALAEGRTRVVRSILNNKQALSESLPAFIPNILRRPLRFVARDAVKRLDKKYAHLLKAGALQDALIKTRAALMESDNDFLLGRFSYADIAMAVVLEVVDPIAYLEKPLGLVTQSLWHDSVMADKFEDLLFWRNRLAASDATTYSQFRAGMQSQEND